MNRKSGSFTCIPPQPGQHGFLRIDTHHPYSFVWDDGTRYFMWGQTYYDILQPAMVNDNWKTSIAKSLEYGMNKLRMHVYAQNFYKPGDRIHQVPRRAAVSGRPTEPGRDRLNIAYLRKLDEMVQYMSSKGVLAELILTNPYFANREFGTAEQNDRFLRYLVARYAAWPNVIWCMANEWGLSAKAYKGASPAVEGRFRPNGRVGAGGRPLDDGGRRVAPDLHSQHVEGL